MRISQYIMPFPQVLYRVTQKRSLEKVSTGLEHALNLGSTLFTHTETRYCEKITLAI